MNIFDIFAKRSFEFNQVPDLKGKVALITGSNTGVSFCLYMCCIIPGYF